MKARCPICYAVVTVEREKKAQGDHYSIEDHKHLQQERSCPGSGSLIAGFKVMQDDVS